TLHDYLQVVRRRKWSILFAVVLVQLLAMLFTLSQTSVYQATAQVLLSRQSLANSLNGLQDPSLSIEPDRFPQTQADLARSPAVAARVLAQLRLTNRTVPQLLANSSVSPAAEGHLLEFIGCGDDPTRRGRVANAQPRPD